MKDKALSVTIASMNVRGLTDKEKRRDVFNWLRDKKYGIYCLQDFHGEKELQNHYKAEWGYETYFSFHTPGSRGCAILLANNFESKVHKVTYSTDGNYIIMDINIYELRVTLVCLYGPNKDSPQFYINLSRILQESENATFIIVGDWNIILDQEKDSKNYMRNNNPKARLEVQNMIEHFQLQDIWRVEHPDAREFSWRSNTRPVKFGRLDFFLATEDIQAIASTTKLMPGYRTDHSLVKVDITFGNMARGSGVWKLNTSLLKDAIYVGMVKDTIKNTVNMYKVEGHENNEIHSFSVSDQMLFEMLKMEIRGMTIKYSSQKKKQNIAHEKRLNNEILLLETQLTANPSSNELNEKLREKQDSLYELRKNKIAAIMIRSKSQYYEEGEKPTKYFFSLEKRNYLSKLIPQLNVDGNIITDQNQIRQKQADYYKHLYRSHLTEDDASQGSTDLFLKPENIVKLSDEQKNVCEEPILENELKEVIRNMKNNKTPGSDGFPVEFYKFFWKDIGSFLKRSLDYSFYSGQLSITQREGIITCIPKGDKTRTLLKNWRPISLLNTDYKILTAVLANRIKNVLPSIINSNQKGYLKGRFIGENTRLIYDIMHYLSEKNRSGLLLLIDFEKAFDTIEWSFIRKVLKKYNFGNNFLKWFSIIYKDVKSYVLNNGYLSPSFLLERGCRQGDPFSAYIFILSIEPLAMELYNNQACTGITIMNKQFKLGQYADDTFLLLDGREDSLRQVIYILNQFHVASGLKINIEKTQAVWLGSMKHSQHRLCPDLEIQWVQQFKLLGITFSSDIKEIAGLNYISALGIFEGLLNKHKDRKLTLLGKVTIIKTLAIPKLIHILSALPSPDKCILDRMQNAIKHFIWDGKRSKISYDKLCRNIEEGGLKLTHLSSLITGLKLAWMKRLFESNADWQMLFRMLVCNHVNLLLSLDFMSIKNMAATVTNIFWKEVLNKWAEYGQCAIETPDQVLSMPIWYNYWNTNDNIQKRKNEWISKGLIYINDLVRCQNQFHDHLSVQQHFDIRINFLDYLGFITSIPPEWKYILREGYNKLDIIVLTNNIFDYVSCPKVTQFVYKYYIDKINCVNNNELTWNMITGNTESWNAIYKIAFDATTETKLRVFQYKMLLRILPTNTFLKVCALVESENCYFCKVLPETLDHLFYECRYIKKLYEQLLQWLLPELDLSVYLNKQNIILGCNIKYNYRLINHILLLTKRYIYVTRCLQRKLMIKDLQKYIKSCFDLEMTVLNDKGRRKYERKWETIMVKFVGT